MGEGEEDDRGVRDAGVDLGANVLGTAGALAVFGSGGGIIPALATAAMPPALVLTLKLGALAMQRRQQRQQQVIEVAAEHLGGLEVLNQIFDEQIPHHDERLELLGRVLEAAGRSTMPAKVQALGRVLADGLRDDAQLHEAFALAAGLEDMEGVHVQLLQYLADHPRPPEAIRGLDSPGPLGWEVRELQQVEPEVASLVEPIVAVLNRHGLVSPSGGLAFAGSGGPPLYSVAPLGERCLWLLHDDEVQGAG